MFGFHPLYVRKNLPLRFLLAKGMAVKSIMCVPMEIVKIGEKLWKIRIFIYKLDLGNRLWIFNKDKLKVFYLVKREKRQEYAFFG